MEEVEFFQGAEQEKVMKKLKMALSLAPALKPLGYMPEDNGCVRRVVLGIDACGLGFGAILHQEDGGSIHHPVRYESRLWMLTEIRYDAVMLECLGLLCVQEKFHYYPYWVQFLIKIDECTLVHQLIQPTSELQGAIVGRWPVYIQLLSINIKHMVGVKHKVPNTLFRRPSTEDKLRKLAKGRELAMWRLEETLDGELDALWVSAEEGKACTGFVIVFFICFLCYFLCFVEERESAAIWWAFVFLSISISMREKKMCRGWGSIRRRCRGQWGYQMRTLRGLRGLR